MRDRDGRVTLTKAETTALQVVVDGGSEGALLSGATRPKLGLIESRTARRLARLANFCRNARQEPSEV